jgi:hypothetical protein
LEPPGAHGRVQADSDQAPAGLTEPVQPWIAISTVAYSYEGQLLVVTRNRLLVIARNRLLVVTRNRLLVVTRNRLLVVTSNRLLVFTSYWE